MGEIFESAFSKLGRLEAMETRDCSKACIDTAVRRATESPPPSAPVGGRPKAVRQRIRFSNCICDSTEIGCCSAAGLRPDVAHTGQVGLSESGHAHDASASQQHNRANVGHSDSPSIEVEDRFAQIERRVQATEERLNAAEQRIDATGRLAEKLDGFAAEVAKHATRLDELGTIHQKAIETLATTIEGKLSIVEAAFEGCDRKIKELQQAAYAAPAAGASTLPGMGEPPGLALLRSRFDELAREVLVSNNRRKELEDRFTAMDMNIRDGYADTACQLVQCMGTVRMECAHGVEAMRVGLEQQIAAGVCKCPMGCPGQGGFSKSGHAPDASPSQQHDRAHVGQSESGRATQPEPTTANAAPEVPRAGRGLDPFNGGKDVGADGIVEAAAAAVAVAAAAVAVAAAAVDRTGAMTTMQSISSSQT